MLAHIDLFSGLGGFALAAQWAGFKTVVFCEIEPFCQEVLKARFGAVADTESREAVSPKPGRLHSQSGLQNTKPLLIPNIRDFDGRRWRGATLLTGGFPCQPFSCAGKRKGTADDRWLWPEMLRVISEARPTWGLGENVAGIVNMELEHTCADVEAEGYEVQPIVIPACAVNAPHKRNRVWIIANNSKNPVLGRNGGRSDGDKAELRRTLQTTRPDSHAPDTSSELGEQLLHAQRRSWEEPWPEVATRLCRVDDGVPRRVDRLKALGNAIVPQVAYEIIKEIARIEEIK